MTPQEELSEFLSKLAQFNAEHVPSFLTPNSYNVGVMPGHHLDLLQISFDYRIDRTWLLSQKVSDFLIDPSGPPKLELI